MTVKQKLELFNIYTGNTLRELRKDINNLTIDNFAEITGLSSKTISNYENGRNTITINTLIAIYESDVYKGSLSELCDAFIVSTYEEVNKHKKRTKQNSLSDSSKTIHISSKK